MSKTRIWFMLSLVIGLAAITFIKAFAESATDKPEFAIRKLEPQVVLYTIHRGSYEKTGVTIGKLFALAGQKGISPRGPVSYVYLNNPKLVSSEHWLVEIRIPVGEKALEFAGTLGEMTDVKALPAMEVAVAVKPEGRTDPGTLYDNLYAWILEQGYFMVEGPMEIFSSGAMYGSYAQMKTEIMLPIAKRCLSK